jgi:hypothetical protein
MSRALIASLLAFVIAAPASAQARFFGAIEDLPLAPGLEEAGLGVYFDSESGRITGALAQGAAAPGAVTAFYMETLPALGWAFSPGAGAPGELVFVRGREQLALLIAPADGGVEMQVRLVTRPAPMNAD